MLLEKMGGIVGARWQDDDQVHLTLAFAGEVDNLQYANLVEALSEADSTTFAADVSGVGHFERKQMPTALWARVPLTDALALLQHRVERACRRAGLAPESRGYRPHITLARLPRSAGPVGDWLAQHGTLRAGPWQVEGFTLYESHLRQEGPLYRALVDYRF